MPYIIFLFAVCNWTRITVWEVVRIIMLSRDVWPNHFRKCYILPTCSAYTCLVECQIYEYKHAIRFIHTPDLSFA